MLPRELAWACTELKGKWTVGGGGQVSEQETASCVKGRLTEKKGRPISAESPFAVRKLCVHAEFFRTRSSAESARQNVPWIFRGKKYRSPPHGEILPRCQKRRNIYAHIGKLYSRS